MTAADELRRRARALADGEWQEAAELAEDPAADDALLGELAARFGARGELLVAIARHPAAGTALLARVARLSFEGAVDYTDFTTCREHIARHAQTDADTLAEIGMYPDADVQWAVLEHPRLTLEVARLVRDNIVPGDDELLRAANEAVVRLENG
jgi:hypothetical protein